MRFQEINQDDRIPQLNTFVDYVLDRLGIDNPPQIEFINDRRHAAKLGSFGGFSLDDHSIRVNIAGRHIADIMRTLAHEIVHYRQNGEKEGGLTSQEGATGTDYENEANALAGQIMRDYARRNPKIFESRR